jgi:hypothetical protein
MNMINAHCREIDQLSLHMDNAIKSIYSVMTNFATKSSQMSLFAISTQHFSQTRTTRSHEQEAWYILERGLMNNSPRSLNQGDV